MSKGTSAAASVAMPPVRRGKSLGRRILEHWQLYLLLLVPVVITVIYKYIPMYGVQIAFRDFKASRGFLGSEWVGWDWFERFFTAPTFSRMIRNTVLLSFFKYAMAIDFEQEPPMFQVSDTHYAATWLLHPNAPKAEPPKIVVDRIERMSKKGVQ